MAVPKNKRSLARRSLNKMSRINIKYDNIKKNIKKIMNLLLGLSVYLSISLFIIGLCGIFMTHKNLIVILISIELLLLAVNLNFIAFSIFMDDFMGQIFVLFTLTVAAAESAIGLAILVVYYRLRGILAIDLLTFIKG